MNESLNKDSSTNAPMQADHILNFTVILKDLSYFRADGPFT